MKKKEAGSIEFAGSAKELGEFVDHNAKEEETSMFRMARKLFSKEELAAMDEEYDQWKGSPDAAAAPENAFEEPSAEPVVRRNLLARRCTWKNKKGLRHAYASLSSFGASRAPISPDDAMKIALTWVWEDMRWIPNPTL